MRTVAVVITAMVLGLTVLSVYADDADQAVGPRYDRYGQSTLYDWPGKIRNDQQLRDDVEADKAYYGSLTPPEFDPYGGLLGSQEDYQLEATGYFRVEQLDNGRWVMVTPLGNIYFALTVGGLFSYHDWITVQGREDDFAWLPERHDKTFGSGYKNKGRSYSFYWANWIRKFGHMNYSQWKHTWVDRLRGWGFNSHNAYGTLPGISVERHFPVTLVLQGVRRGKSNFISGFYDPFDAQDRRIIQDEIQKAVEPYAESPELIGYYVQNEADFSFIPLKIPQQDGACASKQRLVDMLVEQYETVEAFNEAWEMSIADFDELLGPIAAVSTQAGRDMLRFQELFLHEYFSLIRDTFKQYDQNHLLLGCRRRARDGRTDLVNRVLGQYMDVMSINYYCYYFEKDSLARAYEQAGRPFILSEWNYDTSEQGLTRVLRAVDNQTQRGKAYRNYVEQAASLPFIVGVQWWCMLDHQQSGWNTGLVNVADQPYKDFLSEVVKTNYSIYDVMLGKRPPFAFDHPLFKAQSGDKQQVADVSRALAGHKVDGAQSPWPDRPSYRVTAKNKVFGSDAGRIEADFWLCWDQENLYVYVDVFDPIPRINHSSGRGVWNGDGVEIFLGHLSDEQGMSITDRQLLISAARHEKPVYYWYNSPKQYDTDIVILDAAHGEGYIIEAAIPFSAFNYEPESGGEFLFDLVVNDSEGKGRVRQFAWNGTAENSTNHAYWGRARLGE